MTPKVLYLSLGSNQGNRLQYLVDAIQLLEKEKVGKVFRYSSVYESESWGFEGLPFYNICVGVHYTKSLQSILIRLQYIEHTLNRIRHATNSTHPYHDRTIDIDILLTLDTAHQVLDTERLQLPHPRMHLRKFVLQPLYEIAPQLIHPVLQKDIQVLLEECQDTGEIHCLRGYDLERLVINNY